jgi:hypothetical protein
MGKIFTRKQFSNYLGEQRAILDVDTEFFADIVPTPTPSPVTPTPTPTPTSTPTPSPIATFNIGSGFDATTQSILYDGTNLFVGGLFYGYDGTLSQGALVKLDTNGNIDDTFNTGIVTSLPGIGNVFGIQEDETGDYIYIVGAFNQTSPTLVQRIAKVDKVTGLSVWPSIACNNTVSDISVDPLNGDVYLVGAFTNIAGTARNRIAKFDKNGTLDAAVFTVGLNNTAARCIINRNGNLMVTGSFTTYEGLGANRIIEIELTSYTDTGFWGTGASQFNQGIFQRSDNGEYILVGNGGTINGVTIGKVAKFDETGTNIPFTTALGGIVPAGLYVDEVNDYIYISNSQSTAGIRRYEYGTGNTDTTFENNVGTFVPVPSYSNVNNWQAIAIDSSNRIYLRGAFNFLNGNSRNRIVRLLQDGTDNTSAL